MQIFDIAIAPNNPRPVDVAASYVYFYEGSAGGADTTLLIQRIGDGATALLRPGQAIKFPASSAANTKFLISNVAGQAVISGKLLFANGEFSDNRVTGSVEVVDGGRARTLMNQAFVAGASCTSDAASIPAFYLQNPAGSGKNIIVKACSMSANVAQPYGVATVPGVTGEDVTAAGIVSKSGDGGFVAKAYRNVTGPLSVSGKNSYVSGHLQANQTDRVVLQEPIVIRPGRQIMAFATVANCNIIAVFECIEEVI
jgi:hypothetical protein